MLNFLNKFRKNKKADGDPNQMGMLQRLALKKIEKMSLEEREKLAQKVVTPENIAKNKDKILDVLNNMRASGQLSADQFEEAKKKLGI
jgi:hypothetical protein